MDDTSTAIAAYLFIGVVLALILINAFPGSKGWEPLIFVCTVPGWGLAVAAIMLLLVACGFYSFGVSFMPRKKRQAMREKHYQWPHIR